jgi:malate dehydrogenase (oxaloacetate-decarboxylating)(NADP+)
MSRSSPTDREKAIFCDPEAVLDLHRREPRGKISMVPTKACRTSADLALAYSPGVAIPCLRIQNNPDDSYEYTVRGNLVAVISNGTAVLGLGNIGAAAAKPVMEGKAMLFKRFAGIDAIDLEVNTQDPVAFVEAIRLLEPSFGGINLEDIRAPDCFFIEHKLQAAMSIPVFHDDQHGTAVVVAAAVHNAVHLTGRRAADLQVVFCGAGAAGLACASLLLELGVQPDRLLLVDLHGVVYSGRREGMDPWKEKFAGKTSRRTLGEALVDADLFVGVSAANVLNADMIKAMRRDPLLFALANPVPEIDPVVAMQARPDAILATGRSDLPNQINNVLGFPFLFRGALDARAPRISTGMQLAAVKALAELAREPAGRRVHLPEFGRTALLPSPFDPRLLSVVASAVAEAAFREGIAATPIADLPLYRSRLEGLAQALASF